MHAVDFSDDANGETGTGEGVTHNTLLRNAELTTECADFVLEEETEWLHDGHFHLVRQATDVMMTLDNGTGALERGGLDDIRVQSALEQETWIERHLQN